MTTTPWSVLAARVRSDGATPLLTLYDDATGERVETSAVTFANWVAKTANLLVDELEVEPGEVVTLDLPAHWQSYVLGMAICAVGASAGPGGRVRAVAEPAPPEVALSADTLVLSLRPFGAGRLTPGPGIDYATEVRLHGDYFPGGDGADAAGASAAGGAGADLVAAAHGLAAGLPDRLRLLTSGGPYDLVGDLLLPLVRGGSTVLVRNEDPAGRARRVQTERVTHVRGPEGVIPVV